MVSFAEYERALAELKAELADIAQWSSAPHLVYAREMQAKGQLDLDYQSIERKLQNFHAVLSPAKQVEFDGCMRHVSIAFGEMIIHAGFPYDDQLNVMRGWPEAWEKLDSALKGIEFFLNALSMGGENPGRSGGAGGPRVDLFITDRGCA